MKTTLACIPCFVRQIDESMRLCGVDEADGADIMRRLLRYLADADWNVAPVALAQKIHQQIRSALQNPDPYLPVKQRMNKLARELLPELRRQAAEHNDPIEAAARIAITGNLLDSGAKTSLSDAEVRAAMDRVFHDRLCGSAQSLLKAAQLAKRVLFLADNAGEIVFDRMLIELLPTEKMVVAVRGSPIINDAIMADAEFVGLPEIVPVISNGSDAPGTLLDDCSEEFRQIFDGSDLIIAKGQGNYESLSDTTKHIFFLLRVKCPLVGGHIGADMGDMVIRERNGVPAT